MVSRHRRGCHRVCSSWSKYWCQWWRVWGLGKNLGAVRLHQLSIFDSQLNPSLDRPQHPMTTTVNQPPPQRRRRTTVTNPPVPLRVVVMTVNLYVWLFFLFFFFCFTNGLPSSSSTPHRTHNVKHREDNGAMRTPSPTPSAYAHYKYSFFLSFILLTIYLPAHLHRDFHADSSALHVRMHSLGLCGSLECSSGLIPGEFGFIQPFWGILTHSDLFAGLRDFVTTFCVHVHVFGASVGLQAFLACSCAVLGL